MKLIKLSNIIINVQSIAFAKRSSDGELAVHFNAPSPQAATGHYILSFTGADAKTIWDELRAMGEG